MADSKPESELAPGEDWLPLPLSPIPTRQGESVESKLWEWSLVLSARRVPHHLRLQKNARELLTAPEHQAQALSEISAYEAENHTYLRVPKPTPFFNNTHSTIYVLLCLALFHVVTLNQWHAFGFNAAQTPLDWKGLGSADCYNFLILSENWRVFTALTLHADAAHLLANLVFGGMVFVPLCRELGSGPGWLVTILAGGLGNVLNCRFLGPTHASLGASTAVFGAIGALCAVRAVRDVRLQQFNVRALLLPVAVGVMLFGFLGTGGGNGNGRTDVTAHLFGLIAGLGLGALVGLSVHGFGLPGRIINMCTCVLALLLVIGSWAWAFLFA